MAVVENSTTVLYEWEYYYGYLDPPFVDQSKLKYNKYSIVIMFWIVLVAFVGFLFFGLNFMPLDGKVRRSHRTRNKGSHRASTA